MSGANPTAPAGDPWWARLLLARRIHVGVFVALVALLPGLLGGNRGALAFVVLVLVYATAAQSLVLLYGAAGIMSVGQGALVGLVGYATAIMGTRTGLPFWLVVLCAVAFGVVASGLLALTSIRTGGHYFVIVTFAFGEIAVAVANNLPDLTGGNGGLPFVKPLQVFGHTIGPIDLVPAYYVCAVVLLASMGLVTVVLRGRFGDRLVSIRENPELASALGVDVRLTKLLVFMGSAVFTGIAGVLWGYQTHFLSPEEFRPASLGITLVLAALIGGARSPLGPVIGAAIALLGPQLFDASPYLNEMLLGLTFVLVILLMPEGITGACAAGIRRIVGRLRARRHEEVSPR